MNLSSKHSHGEIPDVTVVLVTFSSADIILGALASIPPEYPVIVVDNASRDRTVDLIRASYPDIELVLLSKNIGFGCANNEAINRSSTPFVLLMNPDARLIDPDTVKRLRAKADLYPNAAIISPSIVDSKGERQMALPAPVLSRKMDNRRFDMSMVAGDVCAYSLSGAFMLLRKSCFEGKDYYFDPNIFLYFEDDDICMDANRRGYQTVLTPEIVVMHDAGQSSGGSLEVEVLKTKHRTCAKLYLIGKYHGRFKSIAQALKLLLRNLLGALGYAIACRRKKYAIARSRISGVLLYLSGRYQSVTRLVD